MNLRYLLLCLLIGLTACGTRDTVLEPTSEPARPTSLPAILTGPDTPGVLRPVACPFVLPEDIVEGEDVECGYLPVLEDRTEKSSEDRLIRLAVAVFHPPGGATEPDPVIYLSGGPGASILKMIYTQYDLLSEPDAHDADHVARRAPSLMLMCAIARDRPIAASIGLPKIQRFIP